MYCDVGGGRVRYLPYSSGKILLVYLNRNNGPTGTWEMFFSRMHITLKWGKDKGRERTNLKSISVPVTDWIK